MAPIGKPTAIPTQNSTHQAPPAPHKRPKSSRRLIATIATVLVLLGLLGLAKSQGWLPFLRDAATPDPNLHQALFLTNGQVYFGKVMKMTGEDFVMEDIYYLQVTQPLQQQPAQAQPKTGEEPQLNLIKMGTEIHGPTDKMVIPRTSVVFWEDIKADGTVAKAIADYKNKK